MGIFFSHLWFCSPKSKNRQASEGRIRSVSHFQIEQICTVPQTNHRFAGFPGKHRQTFNNVILESLITLLEHEGCMDRLSKRETSEVTTELLRKKKEEERKQRGRASKPGALMSYLSVLLGNGSDFCFHVVSCQATYFLLPVLNIKFLNVYCWFCFFKESLIW